MYASIYKYNSILFHTDYYVFQYTRYIYVVYIRAITGERLLRKSDARVKRTVSDRVGTVKTLMKYFRRKKNKHRTVHLECDVACAAREIPA